MADVRCLLSEAASISKHEPAIVTRDRRLLYHELEERVNFAVAHLRSAGMDRGARIAIWLENDWRHLVLLLAVIRAGGVAVPISLRWPAKLVAEQLRKLDCRLLITDAALAATISDSQLQIISPESLLTFSDTMPQGDVRMDVNQPAVIVFTSGSTGEPRAAQLSYGNLYYNALGSNRNLRLTSHDRWLLTLPLCHVGGLGVLFRCLQAGACVVLPEPRETIEAVQTQFRATHLSLVATQLHRLLQLEKIPDSFAAVRAVLVGGSAVSHALFEAARQKRLPIFATYGLTEMASQVTTMRPDSPPPKRETSGKLLRYRDLILADDGEILVCGETLFQGYIENGNLRDGRDANGWFHTGDLGSLDADDYLTVRGRKDFMFISGGENIHPEEIEAALLKLGDIEQALVVPIADAEFGHRPVAFLRTPGRKPAAKALALRLGEWLPKFKIPVAFHPWPEELSDTAKPNRRHAAELAAKLSRAA